MTDTHLINATRKQDLGQSSQEVDRERNRIRERVEAGYLVRRSPADAVRSRSIGYSADMILVWVGLICLHTHTYPRSRCIPTFYFLLLWRNTGGAL